VTFDEADFDHRKNIKTVSTDGEHGDLINNVNSEEQAPETESSSGNEAETNEISNEQTAPGRSIRTTAGKPPKRFVDEFAYHHCAFHIGQIDEPLTMQEALHSEYSKEWGKAAEDKYKSLIEN